MTSVVPAHELLVSKNAQKRMKEIRRIANCINKGNRPISATEIATSVCLAKYNSMHAAARMLPTSQSQMSAWFQGKTEESTRKFRDIARLQITCHIGT
jgi:hypothetical protein